MPTKDIKELVGALRSAGHSVEVNYSAVNGRACGSVPHWL